MRSVSAAGGTFAITESTRLSSLDGYLFSTASAVYDVAPEGRSFIMLRSEAQTGSPDFILVNNFFEELRHLVPN